jgi:hypothetical protein
MDAPIARTLQLVRHLQVPVTTTSIKKGLEEHPDFPSLLAVSDVLRDWEIPHAAYWVYQNDIEKIPVPFIAHLTDNGGKFLFVTKVEKDYIIYEEKKNRGQKMPVQEFNRLFTGNILIAGTSATAGDPDYAQNRREEILESQRMPFIFMAVVLLVLYAIFFAPGYMENLNWRTGMASLAKISGVIVSVLLLMQNIDANNPIVQRFCTGDKSNCNMILTSNAAKLLWGMLSWSEVGYTYFMGTLLMLIFNSGSIAMMQLLAVVNILALPYTVYSIYYQTRVARQWCVLCCSIQALLWIECIALVGVLSQPYIFPGASEWGAILLCFLSPVAFWVFLKPFLSKAQQVIPLKQQLTRFKLNKDIFKKMLADQEEYILLSEEDSLVMGNSASDTVITVVLGMNCSSCHEAYHTLMYWLDKGADFKLQIVFGLHADSNDQEVAIHALSLNIENKELLKEGLKKWFDQENLKYEDWALIYPTSHLKEADTVIGRQKEWCKYIQLRYTPTILINGRRLPQPYELEDIRFFI